MKSVILHFFGAHGLERAESDVESNFGDFDSPGANAIENFGREVQAGGGSGY